LNQGFLLYPRSKEGYKMKQFQKKRRPRALLFATALASALALAFLTLAGCPNPSSGGGEDPLLVDIEAKTSKTAYIRGEDLDLSTITVTGVYSDGSKQSVPITGDAITGYDKDRLGEQTLTVTVEGKRSGFKVTVLTPEEALETAIEDTLSVLEDLAVSRKGDGSDVPAGAKWISPEEKEELDEVVQKAKDTAKDGAAAADIKQILKELQEAGKTIADVSKNEDRIGSLADWSFTVSFNVNGGTESPAPQTVAAPSTTVDSLPSDPTRTGYIFSGWNTGEDGYGSPFSEKTPVTGDITVYAKWTLIVNAQAPVISGQPQGANYTTGAEAAPLSITAESPDGGTLSYQWYHASSGGAWALIPEAAGPSYLPPTGTVGAVSYYAVVTNTNTRVNGTKTARVNSAVATVAVSAADAVNARAPVISGQPQTAAYLLGAAAAPLSVTAAVTDGGTLSYQWYSRAETSDDWTAITGAAGASYTPPTGAMGTVYYYAGVTNTNTGVSGIRTARANSEAAAIVVRVNAQAPVISGQPQDADYTIDEEAAPLSVTAAVTDGGTLSYQWYHRAGTSDDWTAIAGAAGASYTPPTGTAGTLSYYAGVTNTNTGVNGVQTARVNSAVATVAVSATGAVNAQAPVISGQPQSAAYRVGDVASPLAVTAASPDGGTLSYQWYRRTGTSSGWTVITGAAGASYTPSTAASGTFYYYAALTNTNTGVSGVQTARANSNVAVITVSAGFTYTAWANEDGSLLNDVPESLVISKSLEEDFTLSAAEGLTGIRWSLNGINIPAPRGTAQSITIEAVSYAPGAYTLGLYAEKAGIPYSSNITFTVDN
jgi:uncharacterized repeat protein (TIGR02543 family)